MPQIESFEIDDVTFRLDLRAGVERGTSSNGEFVLVKPDEFIAFYRTLQKRTPKDILEIGMFEGGSLVLFDKLFSPEKLVGIDIRKSSIEALEQYRRNREHIVTYYGQSQGDPHLPTMLEEEFPRGIDLIVDDASHHYLLSRTTFHSCFPHLKPGGLYVIEDWSWSHKPASQTSAHPWFDKPALTNLIVDLVVNLPGSDQISNITIHRDLAVVEKAAGTRGNVNLVDGYDSLRGRSLNTF